MKILCILTMLGISMQAYALEFSIVEAEGHGSDCCFRTLGDIDVLVMAAEDVKTNLSGKCHELYGGRGHINFRTEKILELSSVFERGGSSVIIRASARCLKKE